MEYPKRKPLKKKQREALYNKYIEKNLPPDNPACEGRWCEEAAELWLDEEPTENEMTTTVTVVSGGKGANMSIARLLAAASIAGPYCGMDSRCEPRPYDNNPDRSRGAKEFRKKKSRRKMAKASRRANRNGGRRR